MMEPCVPWPERPLQPRVHVWEMSQLGKSRESGRQSYMAARARSPDEQFRVSQGRGALQPNLHAEVRVPLGTADIRASHSMWGCPGH